MSDRAARLDRGGRDGVRRRDVLAATLAASLTGTLIGWPCRARAQARPRTIGYLDEGSLTERKRGLKAFRAGLAETGFVVGRDVVIAFRQADNDPTRLPELARELVRLPADVIVAPGSLDAIRAAAAATATIPILFSNAGDWTRSPLIASLRRPGGNVTGISDFGNALSAKRVELLKLLVPGVSVVAVLVTTSNRQSESDILDARARIRSLGADVLVSGASTPEQIEAAFATFAQRRVDGLCVAPSMLYSDHAAQIVELAARHRLPAIYPYTEFARLGGLMSYGADMGERARRTGVYAGLLLKGASPADLPVYRLTSFELAINITAAKALGLTVAPRFLALADKVIE
jgi:putative tryptophan/tyrosine transport system substrate-binding protein